MGLKFLRPKLPTAVEREKETHGEREDKYKNKPTDGQPEKDRQKETERHGQWHVSCNCVSLLEVKTMFWVV